SKDLRLLVVLDMVDNITVTESAAKYRIHKATILRIRNCWNQYGLLFNPLAGLKGIKRVMCERTVKHLQFLFRQRADWYIFELQEELEAATRKKISIATVWRCLHRIGMTYKQLSHRASERNEAQRAAFLQFIAQFNRNELIFFDEAAWNEKSLERRRGYGLKGMRAV
ncbi:hypothetical protein BDR26DRAFT_793799, partial [Obelidium mucronatum]